LTSPPGDRAPDADQDRPAPNAELAFTGELSPQALADIEATAGPFVDALLSAAPGSDGYRRAIRAIDGLGDREVRTTTRIVAAFHERPRQALRDVLADQAPLRRNLELLNRTARDVEGVASHPAIATTELATAIRRAETCVREVVPALEAAGQALEQDNAELAQQERALWAEILTLRRYAALAARLDDLIVDRIASIEADDDSLARSLRDDVLLAVRRRRRDVLLQLAVASQGYAALRLIEQDNLQVIWAIRGATTTTVTALRIALLVAQTMGDRRFPGAPVAANVAAGWHEVVVATETVEVGRQKTLAEVNGRDRR
jgi:hypothetical protein